MNGQGGDFSRSTAATCPLSCNTKADTTQRGPSGLGCQGSAATEDSVDLACNQTAKRAPHGCSVQLQVCQTACWGCLRESAKEASRAELEGARQLSPCCCISGHPLEAPRARMLSKLWWKRTLQLTPGVFKTCLERTLPNMVHSPQPAFCCCRFAAGRGMGPTFEQLFTCAVEALHDTELPVSPPITAPTTGFRMLGRATTGACMNGDAVDMCSVQASNPCQGAPCLRSAHVTGREHHSQASPLLLHLQWILPGAVMSPSTS